MQSKRKIGISKGGQEMHYSAGIIVKCKDKYLLLDRINIPFGFACLGGHVDEGEESLLAALRELKEETGILAKELKFLAEEEIPWNYCKSASVHYWYLYTTSVENEDFIFDKEEVKSMDWYSLEEIKNLQLEKVWEYWFKKLGILEKK